MSKALLQLMLMQLRGMLRRGFRQVRTPRGAIFFGFGVLIFASWLVPNLMNIQEGKPTLGAVRNVMPLVLLGVTLLTTLTSAGEKAIASTGDAGLQELMDDPREVLQRFGQTNAGRILLAPFYVLTRVITARPLLPDLLKWAPIGLAMNLVLVGLILMLDTRFVEAAAGA